MRAFYHLHSCPEQADNIILLKIMCEEVITEHYLKSFKRAWNLQCCHGNKISDRLNQVNLDLYGYKVSFDSDK